MKVLIACEFSGIVREAFKAKGHDVISVDLLPTEIPGNHIIGDIFKVLQQLKNKNWIPKLLIGHPVCTYICNSGVRWLYNPDKTFNQNRWEKMHDAHIFFYRLWDLDIEQICLENPIPTKHAMLPEYSQIIQPWQFGHGETKATCLWLKNLTPLKPSNIVSGRLSRVHHEPPSKNRWKNRSRTYLGIAQAMADQWG